MAVRENKGCFTYGVGLMPGPHPPGWSKTAAKVEGSQCAHWRAHIFEPHGIVRTLAQLPVACEDLARKRRARRIGPHLGIRALGAEQRERQPELRKPAPG